MPEPILRIYKKIGETPLEALNKLRLENPKYKDLPMTYAGRLDPMAEGELLVLTGEECKKKDEYLDLDKEYEFEMLFGFKTDSYDLLGISNAEDFSRGDLALNLPKILKNKKGKFTQKYPPFSSKTINGVPLFKKTKDGDIFELPERGVEIYEIIFLGLREIKSRDLLNEIEERIKLVNGDFRQKEIIEKWRSLLADKGEESFVVARAQMTCSSGTYVRSLVNALSFPATTFSIKRIRVFKK